MLELSRQAETTMIVTGLAAGSIASLLCIIYTCYLLSYVRRKDVDSSSILPTTAAPTAEGHHRQPDTTATAARNAALLAALMSVRREVPLPPPSNIVPVVLSSKDSPKATNERKRKFSSDISEVEVQVDDDPGSWKKSHEIHPSRQVKRAVLRVPSEKEVSDPSLPLLPEDNKREDADDAATWIDGNVTNTTIPKARWRMYPRKLRRSVSDETCADVSSTKSSSPCTAWVGPQHV